MTEFERFDQNARSKGILIDTNLLVLLIVGSVNRDHIPRFKRTSSYTPADWDLLIGILEQVPRRYAIPHILTEVSTLTDLKGPELEAKNRLSRLVKEALDGKEVVIASNGEPMVQLVPVARKGRLRGWGKLKRFRTAVDTAFSPEVDEEVAGSLEGQS